MTKDFDADEPVTRWLRFGDIAHWGIFAAFDSGKRVGGAVVAYDTPGVQILEGRRDLAVLWDIRVHPDHRGVGIGTRLLERTIEFARASNCRRLKVESQNNNPAACHFYAKQGFRLGAVHPNAYPEYPDEVQLLWFLEL